MERNQFRFELAHVGINQENEVKAKKYLESKGIYFDAERAVYADDGQLNVIYFSEDIARFRIRLTRRQ